MSILKLLILSSCIYSVWPLDSLLLEREGHTGLAGGTIPLPPSLGYGYGRATRLSVEILQLQNIPFEN